MTTYTLNPDHIIYAMIGIVAAIFLFHIVRDKIRTMIAERKHYAEIRARCRSRLDQRIPLLDKTETGNTSKLDEWNKFNHDTKSIWYLSFDQYAQDSDPCGTLEMYHNELLRRPSAYKGMRPDQLFECPVVPFDEQHPDYFPGESVSEPENVDEEFEDWLDSIEEPEPADAIEYRDGMIINSLTGEVLSFPANENTYAPKPIE